MDDFQQTLDKFNVPAAEETERKAIASKAACLIGEATFLRSAA